MNICIKASTNPSAIASLPERSGDGSVIERGLLPCGMITLEGKVEIAQTRSAKFQHKRFFQDPRGCLRPRRTHR